MIAYTDPNTGNVHACTLISSVPDGVTGYEVPAPTDRDYRDAWEIIAGNLGFDMVKAKELAHDKRRVKRIKDFEPYDATIMLNIPGQDAADAEVARADIRIADTAMQAAIDAANNINELKVII